jgi:hypothetical protein
LAAFSFLRIFQKRYITATAMMAPTPTPAPIPAFAPVESPAGASDDSDVPGSELDGRDALLVVVDEEKAEVVEDATSVVADAVSVVDLPLIIVPTTSY